jgi:hypothetical protein
VNCKASGTEKFKPKPTLMTETIHRDQSPY